MARWIPFTALIALSVSTLAAAYAQTAEPAAEITPQVTLNADNIFVDEATNTVIAEGNVEAQYEGRVMRADRLEYNRTTDKVRASGNVIILDPDGTERFADEIETDSNLSDGYAVGFSTRLPEGGIATSETAIRQPGGFNALDKVIYTACELCEGETRPTWALRARRAVLDQEEQMMSYRDAVIEIGGIPVVYLPYFAHPDPTSGRRSGFLPPTPGLSSKLGAFYQQPYYWAISPYSDLTIAPMVTANVNPLLAFEYRKRFWSGDLNLDFSFTNEAEFDSDGERFGDEKWRGHLFGEGQFSITQNWLWGFGVEQVSDDLYTRRYDISGEGAERGLYRGQPRRGLNQLFLQGQGQAWYADASLLAFEGLRAGDQDDTLPEVAPLLFAEQLFDFGDNGLLSVAGSAAFLTREAGVDSQRATLSADWGTTRILPGGFALEPFVDVRYDTYDLGDTTTGVDRVERSAANAGFTLSYPLFRAGKSVDILIEPTAMIAAGTSDVNDADIPVEDSLLFEFDETRLFDSNGYSGFDLYDDGNKASAGISATMRWKNGISVSALGGRRWRSESSSFLNESSNLDGTVSDWVGGLSADFGSPLKLETRVRLDDKDLNLNRIDAKASTRFWRLNGSVRYFKVDEQISASNEADEGIDIRGEFQLTERYSFVYGRQRDITDDRDVRHTFGLAYEDDCSRFELAFERSESIDRRLGPTDALRFRFSLKTLGDFGSNDVD